MVDRDTFGRELWCPVTERRTIYVVTSTYLRTNQVAEMVQLAQTLMLVPDVYWIVTEDTRLDNEFLLLDGDSVHVPEEMHPVVAPPWLGSARTPRWGGSTFAADGNIRSTRGVSVFPVGLAKDLQLSTPVVKEGRFSGWYDDFEGDLQFPVEFAGFAFSVELLLKVFHDLMPTYPGRMTSRKRVFSGV
nr:galactosylgalactosylxylosylprotein 3-beta-glucuronosyltransferase 2-like [Penaeus vannamei]